MTVRFADGVKPLLAPIDMVHQHAENPNQGDLQALVESIEINGFVTAITADAHTGNIIAGNHRYQALVQLGATHIPVIWVDHMDATGAKRYMVADNQTGHLAVMDDAALLEILKDLHESSELGLAGTGFSENDYEKMLLESAIEAPPEGMGFGATPGALGQYQVVLDFEEDEDERDRVFAILSEQYEHVRTANL